MGNWNINTCVLCEEAIKDGQDYCWSDELDAYFHVDCIRKRLSDDEYNKDPETIALKREARQAGFSFKRYDLCTHSRSTL